MVLIHPHLRPLLVPIDSVAQFPDNPNNGDVDKIRESMLVNGVYQPVIAQRSTGFIVAGNHRYAALLSLGETQIPAIFLDIEDLEAKRIVAVDNRTSELAVRDEALLADLLTSLTETERGLVGTGYDDGDLALYLSRIDDPATLGEFEDDGVRQNTSTGDFTCPNCGWSAR